MNGSGNGSTTIDFGMRPAPVAARPAPGFNPGGADSAYHWITNATGAPDDYSGLINATVGPPPLSQTPTAPVYGAGAAPHAVPQTADPFLSDPGYAAATAAENEGLPANRALAHHAREAQHAEHDPVDVSAPVAAAPEPEPVAAAPDVPQPAPVTLVPPPAPYRAPEPMMRPPLPGGVELAMKHAEALNWTFAFHQLSAQDVAVSDLWVASRPKPTTGMFAAAGTVEFHGSIESVLDKIAAYELGRHTDRDALDGLADWLAVRADWPAGAAA